MDLSLAPWLAIFTIPLALALAVMYPGTRPIGLRFAPFAAMPALVLAIVEPGDSVQSAPWLLLGAEFGLGLVRQIFLFFTATIWLCAGIYSREYMRNDAELPRYWTYFLLTMAGNIGLIVSFDVSGLFCFFILMTFAGYGLIVHEGSPAARRAGKIYITMAVMGEAMLLSGFLLLWQDATSLNISDLVQAYDSSSYGTVAFGLILGGFGIKAGVIPLHIWLPLAHPVAPTPASAVLSGAMIKCGLLGWLLFLPLGSDEFGAWGPLFVFAGLVAALAAAGFGFLQRDPKTVLAYSSVSQMGLMSIGIGVTLIAPDTWPFMAIVVAFYAAHHGFAKAALFLGVGVAGLRYDQTWQRLMITAGLAVPALSLAGSPLTSGAAAKNVLKDSLGIAPSFWEQFLTFMLPVTAIGTTLLMARFLKLTLVRTSGIEKTAMFTARLVIPWLALVLLSASSAWIIPWYFELDAIPSTRTSLSYIWTGLWPVAVGVLIYAAATAVARRGYGAGVRGIPPGDILAGVEWLIDQITRPFRERFAPAVKRQFRQSEALWEAWAPRHTPWRMLIQSDVVLARFGTAGVLLLAVVGVLLILIRG